MFAGSDNGDYDAEDELFDKSSESNDICEFYRVRVIGSDVSNHKFDRYYNAMLADKPTKYEIMDIIQTFAKNNSSDSTADNRLDLKQSISITVESVNINVKYK